MQLDERMGYELTGDAASAVIFIGGTGIVWLSWAYAIVSAVRAAF